MGSPFSSCKICLPTDPQLKQDKSKQPLQKTKIHCEEEIQRLNTNTIPTSPVPTPDKQSLEKLQIINLPQQIHNTVESLSGYLSSINSIIPETISPQNRFLLIAKEICIHFEESTILDHLIPKNYLVKDTYTQNADSKKNENSQEKSINCSEA